MTVLDTLISPLGLLAKPVIWGHPYHGLVHASTLVLPNSSAIPYRQPEGADAWAVQLAGVPPVVRDSGQAAADAAAGYQWLNKLVISGHIPQVYGKSLQGSAPAWIWRDPSGLVWQFSLPRLATYQTSLRVQVRRFGRFGEAPVAPLDIDLTHAVDDGARVLDLSTTTNNLLPDVVLRVCDISSDGSSAIIGIYRDPRRTTFTPRAGATYLLRSQVESALGFVRIDASAGTPWPVLTLTTLRNHRATLGSISSSAVRSPAGDRLDLPRDSTNTYRVGTVTYNIDYSISGRVVGMYFGAGGIPQTIELSLVRSIAYVRDFDKYTLTVPGYGARDFFYRQTEAVDVQDLTLTIGGSVVEAMSYGALPIYADQVAVDGLGVASYLPAGGSTAYHRDATYTVTPFDPYPENTMLDFAEIVPQTGYWPYARSHRLCCLFSIAPDGTVTWTDTHAPGASASAQPPAAGGWIWNGLDAYALGPSSWYRARDPLSGSISAAYPSPVCFV